MEGVGEAGQGFWLDRDGGQLLYLTDNEFAAGRAWAAARGQQLIRGGLVLGGMENSCSKDVGV